MRSWRNIILALLPVVAGLIVVTASSASIHFTIRDRVYARADLQVTTQPGPGALTAGREASFATTVTDLGTADATSVTLEDRLPAGTAFVAASPSQGACAQASGVVACSLGTIAVNGDATVTVVVQTDTTPTTLLNRAHAHGSPADPDLTNNTSNASAQTLAPSQDFAGAFVPPTGGTVSTGSSTSRGNPQSTTATAPPTAIGLPVTVSETATTNTAAACGLGYTCWGQVVGVLGWTGLTSLRPMRISLRLNAHEIPTGESIGTAVLFRNRSIVPACFSTSGGAAPDPCVASRTVLPNGGWKIRVRTSRPGKFRLA